VPEWYLLPFYAILRSVPDKLGGVILMLSAILIFLILPFIHDVKIRSMIFRPLSRFLFWIFFFDSLLLGWIGGSPVEIPYYQIGQFCSLLYFSYFFILIHLFTYFENILSINYSYINQDSNLFLLDEIYNLALDTDFDIYTNWTTTSVDFMYSIVECAEEA
jgi:hypothetical protein